MAFYSGRIGGIGGMIDSTALKLATLIKKANPDETTSIEIMRYSLIIFLNGSLIVTESLLIGRITGRLYETALVLLALAILRFFSGGFHMSSSLGCNLVSTGICTVLPHVAGFFSSWTHLLTILSLILVIAFAPVVDKHTRVRKDKYPLLKLISAMIVCSNFILNSGVIGLTFLIQSITLIPLGRRVNQ